MASIDSAASIDTGSNPLEIRRTWAETQVQAASTPTAPARLTEASAHAERSGELASRPGVELDRDRAAQNEIGGS